MTGALCAEVKAHDSWLIADRSEAADGAMVWLAFVTGEIFPLGDAPTAPERLESLSDFYGDRQIAITGARPEDKTLAVRTPIRGPGLHVVAAALKPKIIELEAETFDRYLREERADRAAALWVQKTPRPRTAVERYTKFAKTVIAVQPVADGPAEYLVPVGHRLEIIPLSNPCAWKSGDSATFEVLLDGHTWPDISVSAGHEGKEEHGYEAMTRTDNDGRATIKLTRPGHWFVKAHLIRPSNELTRYEWESFWASLTFRVGGVATSSEAVDAVAAFHGRKDPWAVAGYRLSQAAMGRLRLARGDANLEATACTPMEPPHLALVDGVQAATGTTIGRATLRLRNVPAAQAGVQLRNRATGETVELRISPEAARTIAAVPAGEVEQAAYHVAQLPEDVLTRPAASAPAGVVAEPEEMTPVPNSPPRPGGR